MIRTIKISVIIPVYNVETYIEECIQSVIEQTLQDIEILIIDDGSTDQSGAICEKYAEKDRRIKLIHTTNQGVSAARNLGMKKASGEWLCFVDGDDELPPNALEKLYLSGANADIVIGRLSMKTKDGKTVYKRHGGRNAERKTQLYRLIGYTVGSYDCCDTEYIYAVGNPVGKLYRKTFCEVEKLTFPSLWFAEDIIFNICAYLKTKHVVFIDYLVYCIHPREESAFHRYAPEFEVTAHQILIQLYKTLSAVQDSEIMKFYDYYKFKLLAYNIERTYAHPHCPIKKQEKLLGIKRLCDLYELKTFYTKIDHKQMSPKLKLLLWLLVHEKYSATLILFQLKRLRTAI